MAAEQFAEVIGTPYTVFVAPVGTVAPLIDDDVSDFDAAWVELGTNGIENQGTAGITISAAGTETGFTPAGGTLEVKSWRTDEAISVAGSIVDTTIEQFALILDNAPITSVSPATGHAGEKSLSLVRGVAVSYFAVLTRGISPYDDGTGMLAQYEFARCKQSATQAPKYLKGTPAELAWQFDVSGTVTGFDAALYRAQDAARLP